MTYNLCMSIRPLALLDLPYLHGFRDEAVGLDATRILTRGNPLGAAGLLSYVNPTRHIYSAIANGDKDSVLGGIIHTRDDTFAKLYYLAPSSQLEHPYLPDLIENLSEQACDFSSSGQPRSSIVSSPTSAVPVLVTKSPEMWPRGNFPLHPR